MPHAAPSRCTEPGCTELALHRGRCGEHRRVGWTTGTSRNATDRLGVSGSAWQRIRLTILKRDDYTCQACGNPGNEVDHIIPAGEGGAKTDPSNLRVLCVPCHEVKSKREAARAARRARDARRARAAVAAELPPF